MGKHKKKKPEIRFKGFTDDWEQRKLGEVLKERTERAKGQEELLSVTISNGVIRQANSDKRNIASEDRSNYKIVCTGDLPYNSMRMWQGAVGNSQYNGIVSPAYTVLVPTDEANSKFFMELFKRNTSLLIFQRWSQGLTSDTWNLKYPVLSSINFNIPLVEEQEKIASYFDKLDHLITLHQRKLNKLKKVKKSMLEKMFPQNGEMEPQIRFCGFNSTWEQRKLTDFVEFYCGQTYKPHDIKTSGTLVLRSSNVKNNEIVDADNVYIDNNIANAEKVRIGDIIVVVRNGSRSLIGKHAEVKKEMPYTTIGAFMVGIRSKHYSFVNALLGTPTFDLEIEKNLGATINQITGYTFSKMKFFIPTGEEQSKIGAYFKIFDNLIFLHQRKLEKLKKIKKAMLEKMFV